MEFPELGQNCSEVTCNQLDFLPLKCDACEKIFCKTHVQYRTHNCEAEYKKDVQVPVCPLCNQPVPCSRGEAPDIKVGEHIDKHCQSDPAKQKRKIYTNKCSLKGCKQKELIQVVCDTCQSNYCLKHRHPTDHDCEGPPLPGQVLSKAGAAALSRFQKPSFTTPSWLSSRKTAAKSGQSSSNHHFNPANIQGSLSEDEALAKALQMSYLENESNSTVTNLQSDQETEDLLLAQALARSEQEQVREQKKKSEKSCLMS